MSLLFATSRPPNAFTHTHTSANTIRLRKILDAIVSIFPFETNDIISEAQLDKRIERMNAPKKRKTFHFLLLIFLLFLALRELRPLYSCWLHFFILLLVVLFTFELSKSSIIIIKLVLVFVAQLFEFSDTNMESNFFAIVSSTMNCLRFEQKYARSEVFGALT